VISNCFFWSICSAKQAVLILPALQAKPTAAVLDGVAQAGQPKKRGWARGQPRKRQGVKKELEYFLMTFSNIQYVEFSCIVSSRFWTFLSKWSSEKHTKTFSSDFSCRKELTKKYSIKRV
jgi:hypothetical protein